METPPPHPHRLGVLLRDSAQRYLARVRESLGRWWPAAALPPGTNWHWRLRNELTALPAFNEQVQARLNATCFPPPDAATCSAILLILDEMLTNVIKYAHPGEAPGHRQIDVRLQLVAQGVVIHIEDDGVPFDPIMASRPAEAADTPLEDRQIGGWGLSLVRRTADAMSYERAGNRNRVILHKHFPVSQVAPA